MANNGPLSIGGGDAVSADSSHSGPGGDGHRPRREPAAEPPPVDHGQRLVIQQDPRTGEWLYTVIDRDSGQVVSRVTRESVARMGAQASYAAGALIKAKA